MVKLVFKRRLPLALFKHWSELSTAKIKQCFNSYDFEFHGWHTGPPAASPLGKQGLLGCRCNATSQEEGKQTEQWGKTWGTAVKPWLTLTNWLLNRRADTHINLCDHRQHAVSLKEKFRDKGIIFDIFHAVLLLMPNSAVITFFLSWRIHQKTWIWN